MTAPARERRHGAASLPESLPSAATLHEAAGRKGALPAAIRPARPGMRMAGYAFPVAGGAGDNLWLHRALAEAPAGSVLVATMGQGSAPDYGYWGEVMTVAAQARGIRGIAIDGGVRDVARLERHGFPVYTTGTAIRGTSKDAQAPGSLGQPIQMGDVRVKQGDLVVGDDDGVVVIPADEAPAVIREGHARDVREQDIFRRLRGGATTLGVYGLTGRP